MTSNSLFTNEHKQTNPSKDKIAKLQKKTDKHSLFLHTVQSHWWLAFICGIVYFFAGPVFTMLYLNGMNFDATHYDIPAVLHQQNVEQIARWMSGEGMIPLYLSAVVLSMILGCVMFAYLQHKRQVNFYHSQPIHRTRLFIDRYAIGFVMNMVLMLIMLGVSLLMIVMYGLGEALSLSGILRHVFNMFALSLASYSISVLAGQLTGTVLTHLAIMLVMHFAVPLATAVVVMMGDIFFATFSMDFPMATLNFSPFCAMFALLSEYSTRYLMYMTAPVMGTAMTVTLLLIGIVFAVLAWFLYQKRPSEATGKSLIYPITEPFVKAYLMFVAALGCGFIFYAVGDQAFFYFGVIAFAILTHMVCQVIIEHDFKAIFHAMKQCAVITALICVAVGVVRFDVFGFDRYLPQPEKVSSVSFQISGLDDYYGTPIKTSDEAVKQQVYTLLEPIVEKELYRGSQFDGYGYSYDFSGERQTSIIVIYELNSGREVKRQYRSVPISAIRDNFVPLYNNKAYRESYYGEILQTPFDKVTYMYLDNYTLYNPSINDVRKQVAIEYTSAIYYETVDEIKPVAQTVAASKVWTDADYSKLPPEYSPEAAQLAKNLYEAYQKDLQDRDFHTLEQVVEKTISLQILQQGSITSSRGYSSKHYNLPVYASDKRTMAILEQYNIHQAIADYNFEGALVFRCDDMTESEMRNVLNDIPSYEAKGVLTEQQLLDGIKTNKAGELVGRIDGRDAVNAFIVESRLKNGAALFRTFDTNHYVVMQYPYDVDGTDAKEWRVELFYSNTVPKQYQ